MRALAFEDEKVMALVDQGKYSEAEKYLRGQIEDLESPVSTPAAIQLEILRRTRYDFSLNADQILEQVQKALPGATPQDIKHWTTKESLQHRVIDGEVRYFRRAASNLFRFSEEAKKRRAAKQGDISDEKFDLTGLIAKLVDLAERSVDVEIAPTKHRVKYELIVKPGHPRLKPGAKVRAWLPFPQEYRQQRDVKLLASRPEGGLVAENGVPQRTIYFEQVYQAGDPPPRFLVEYEFITSAYCPELDDDLVEPYDTGGAIYREFTSERVPHVVFSAEVRRLAKEIVGDESNPLNKAILIFRWVSANIPWCAEMEYSIISNLSAKGLSARRGDCGVQGLTFITLCRAAGVPARWQSGWETKPGAWNMHDWSEFYVEPWGWLPADASYGVRKYEDERVQNFLCGHMDPYRMIVNLDYGRELVPAKTSFRSEPNDFQRGEVEIDGHNLYFNEWTWKFDVETEPVEVQ